MNRDAFRKLFWGFLLIMIDIRIQGVDILPDVIGYYFFYSGMMMLSGQSEHFRKGANYSIPMMVLSVLTLYERPVNSTGMLAPTFSFSPLMFVVSLASLALGLLTAYHLFRGIQDLAAAHRLPGIEAEAGTRWTQYLLINLAIPVVMILVFVPFIFILAVLALFIAVLIYTIKVLQFMNLCADQLHESLPVEAEADSW